jgi:large subunit ribosomal protein L27
MAHKKAGGSKAKQKSNIAGKRLGFKLFGGEAVKSGQIILRQRGTKFHAGDGVQVGRDHTLFAVKEGSIEIKTRVGKKIVEVK